MAAQTVSKPKVARFRILPEGRLERKEALWFWFFISPWAVGFLLFTLGPIVASGYLSLTRYNLSSPPVFVGFDNYANLFGDRIFWKSLQVTAYYTLLAVPLGICLSLVLAVLLLHLGEIAGRRLLWFAAAQTRMRSVRLKQRPVEAVVTSQPTAVEPVVVPPLPQTQTAAESALSRAKAKATDRTR